MAKMAVNMGKSYNESESFQKRDVSPDKKIAAWERFIDAFSEDNPYSDEDDSIRREAKKRIAHWKEIRKTPTEIKEPLPGMEFVLIPGGSFMMGSPSYEKGRNKNEGPQHRVNIKPFYLQTTEVTQAQWKAVMEDNPSYFKGDNLPLETVSWNDCQEFIRKLNQRDPGKGYRLPSEAEWEYACRAGTTTKYYSGNNESDLERVGWYSGNSGNKTHSVGHKQSNNWGLYDMHGNVWEWCEDWYHDSYNGAPTNGSAWNSPSGQYRVWRGGSWGSYPFDCRSADRFRYYPDDRSIYFAGFRLAFSS